ncbi:DUF4062 domain-containing protein [Novilysobacter selenitireducens]|uniref:DUF4062 domain-containing protein n=1 Tax=Novilysobacter selenitireducens TaxID=2872639 RepID=A0ABS7T577_9GAMM|nr:DUF4062 domain-containing protein [Lysobacter selenitireducens]MBZ4039027.1 DUF4062 domain-containing protein [Lysobacter selenitireducens]
MKVFVSSLISGMEEERAAVRRAIELLGHEAVMAEDFGARASSPQISCLQGLRGADLVVLVLGPRYGAQQPSGLSATHEEYREARSHKPILSFVQHGEAESAQAELIAESGSWEGGLYRDNFSTPEELHQKVTQALHRHELAHAAAPLDPTALARRATELVPEPSRGHYSSDIAVQVALAAGPETSILRPAELEAPALRQAIQQESMFGPHPIFDISRGTDSALRSDALVVFQERNGTTHTQVRLWPTGDMLIVLPLGESRGAGMPVVIEEDVAGRLGSALAFASWLLDRIDPTHRITHVAPCAAVVGQGAMGWRTRAEQAASPNSISTGWGREAEREQPVMLRPPHIARAGLGMDAHRLTQDLMALLRRRWSDQGH